MLTEETANDMSDTPSVIWFVPKKFKDEAMKILKFIAKGYISHCAKTKVEIDLLFFVHWKGCDNMHIKEKLQSIAKLPERETVLTIVNFRQLNVRH